MEHIPNSQSIYKKDEEPFFSVVIPTKNRSFLVIYAIKSILFQSFKNFELIIVDNDDTNATQNVVAKLKDSRIRYYKTGNLSMPDNWEYGCTKIIGKYLLIIEDKMALKPNSLQKIFTIIQREKPDVIKWQHDLFDEDTGVGRPNLLLKFKAHFVDSDKIIKSFLDCDLDFFITHSPLGYDSCVSQKIVKTIQNGPIKRLCAPAAPDYTMAFQILNIVDKVFVIPDILDTMGGLKHSNGASFFRKGAQGELFIKELNIKEFDLYSNVPVKVRTPYNMLLNDYINISNAVGGRLTKYELNKFNYYLNIYNELHLAKNENVDVERELNGWNETLSMQDDLFIKKIRKKIDRISQKCQRNNLRRIVYLINMVPKIGIFNVIIRVFDLILWKLSTKKKFRSILEYTQKR
jgi:glycosyltransferase involved in cell wall biosynthesis